MRITALVGLMLIGGLAAQADPAPAPQPAFDAIDRNSDRRISRTEAGYHKQLINRFAQIDTDGDGFISREELYTNFAASNTHSTTGGH